MSETLFPMDASDEVALEVNVSGEAFTFTHANTTLYTYRRYPEVNHIYHVYSIEGEEKQLAIFGVSEVIETLRGLNSAERITPRPTNWDEQAYMEWQRQQLEAELGEL